MDVPSGKRIHYSMMNNYGTQAVRMNQKRVVLGASSNAHVGYNSAGYTSTGYAYGPLNASTKKDVAKDIEVYVSSDVLSYSHHNYSQKLQSIKNTPLFTAAALDAISTQSLAASNHQNQLNSASIAETNLGTSTTTTSNYTETTTADTTPNTTSNTTSNIASAVDTNNTARTRHLANLANLAKLSNEDIKIPTATTTSPKVKNEIAFGFGVGAQSLISKLEAAQESVSEELAQSEASARAHADVTVRIPFAPQEIASATVNVEAETNFGISQSQSLVFEAQPNHTGIGGQANNQSEEVVSSAQVGSSSPDFEVALAAYPTPSSIGVASTNNNQKIATNLTETSTTVVSGLEITLNPNAAVRRETPAEQQAFLWPLSTRGRLTSGYGHRVLAITNNHFHRGIDIAVKTGTPILAVKDGVVEKAGWDGSYGYAVYLRHNDGSETRYAHMSRIIVEKGDWVNQGQWLGLVGSTGLSTGPHLHFELHLSGNAVDPSKHLVFSGERLATR